METAIFFPGNDLEQLLTTRLSFLQEQGTPGYTTKQIAHTLQDFSLFQPKYFSRQVLRYNKGSQTVGCLLVLSEREQLRTLDSLMEEGTVLSRLNVQLEGAGHSGGRTTSACAYVWNGNCRAGEWEYL